jgi:hypothetical protein
MKSMFGAAVIALSLALAGCAKSPFPVIEAKIDALKGQPIKAVIDKLGDPTAQSWVGAEKVYVWTLASNMDSVYQAVGLTCTIRVFVGKDEKVARYSYDGSIGGCGRYAHKLDNTFDTAQGVIDF